PPVIAARLHAGKPSARKVQQHRTADPYCVGHAKVESDALVPDKLRRYLEVEARVAPQRRRQQEPGGFRVHPLEQIKEEGYAAVRDEHVRETRTWFRWW